MLRNRTTILCVALILLLALPATAATEPGRITVYSTPSGAQACIDSKDCDITPATFSVEGNAWHMIVVREAGYRDWVETIYVTSAMTGTASAYLDQDPDATAIRVNVTPGGGSICLDNNQCHRDAGAVNGTGSTLFTGVSPGYHTISVESPAGYMDAMELVQVKLGKVTDVTIGLAPVVTTPAPTLTPVTPMGIVRVYVDRTGSTVCLDNTRCVHNLGGDAGQGTGTMVFDRVTVNETHIVTVAADGCEPFSKALTVERDQIVTVDVRLRQIGGVPTTPATTAPQVVTTVTLITGATPRATTLPTRSAPGAFPVLGALAICGMLVLCRKDRQ
jgi:hypothetical protein